MQSTNHWARALIVVTPRRRASVTARVLEGEAVLYDRVSGCMHRMNETALRIWNACDGVRTSEDVAAEIAAHYEVPRETAQMDVEQVLAMFASAGLIEGVEK